MRIEKLVVVGVGLIGGSCALALKGAGVVREVVGVGRTRGNLDEARARGIVDRALTLDGAWTAELVDADVVLVAAPVAQYPALFAAMAPALGDKTIVTDAGSTKQGAIESARAAFGQAFTRFVAAHPIAGTENSGAAAAFASLYEGRTVIVTPLAETDPRAVDVVRELWESCGAFVRTLAADRHDRIYAAVSHLPHLLAFAFVDSLAARGDSAEYLSYAGGGFRDFTRIAASSPEMWRDIFLANRGPLEEEMRQFRAMLDRFEDAIRRGDAAELDALMAQARCMRREWTARHEQVPHDTPERDR